MSGESLIIAWQDPREFTMRDARMQWALDVKKEIKETKGSRGKWAYVLSYSLADRAEFDARKDALRKVFGFFNTHWDIFDRKFYVRLPWWRL